MRPLLVCDLDGVVFDFDRAWTQRHRLYFGHSQVRPGMVQPWGALHELAGFDTPELFWRWWHRTGGFGNVPLHPGAREALWLAVGAGWDIVYATNRPTAYEEQTLDEAKRHHLPEPEAVLFTEAKWSLPGDMFLEDAPHNLRAMREKGRPGVVRVHRPWNSDQYCPDLADMLTIPDLTPVTIQPLLALQRP